MLLMRVLLIVYSKVGPCKVVAEGGCLGGLLTPRCSIPESEKLPWRIGIANRRVFARTEGFCACLQNWLKIKSKQNISLKSFWIVWKGFGKSGRFPDSLGICWTVWKVSAQSGKVLDNLQGFQPNWKVSGQPGKFRDNREGLQPLWKCQRYIIT